MSVIEEASGDTTKLALLPVVKENIETGCNITENRKHNGSDVTVIGSEVRMTAVNGDLSESDDV